MKSAAAPLANMSEHKDQTLRNASVNDARARMLSAIAPLDVEDVPLSEAAGRVLAAAIVAQRDQPPFSASAMDGYALRSVDAPGTLKVVGESSAGAGLTRALNTGEAARIFTGAPLPEGADSVAIQEDVTRDGDTITAPATPRGENVRGQGIDFKAGATMLTTGVVLDGVSLSLVAATGAASVRARKRPRIAILSTGDEIVAPGETPGPHQIFDSVSFGLIPLIARWGGVATRLKARGDDIDELAAAARAAFETHDLLVTIGGASVGDRDLVKPALATLGVERLVDRANVRPGKPVWYGQGDIGRVLGLPGNPASALVCAHLFLKPIIAAFTGGDKEIRFVQAVLASDLPENGSREHYLRARLNVSSAGQLTVTPFERQDSSLLSIFRDANALISLCPHRRALGAGERVDVLSLDRI